MNQSLISTGYNPRPLQQELHASLKRFSVLVCHRRFGKTVFAINEMIDRGLRDIRINPQYAYVAPTYGQAKRVAWEYLKRFTYNIPGYSANEAELRVDIKRANDHVRFMLLGAENPGSLKGIYLMGNILDEYAECDPAVWGEVIRPALSDHQGWGIFIGTPKGSNHFKEIYDSALVNPRWYTKIYRASETGILLPEELAAAREEMSEEEYQQEFECSFSAALKGAYYKKEMEEAEKQGRITKVPHTDGYPVDCYFDLGMSDTTVIWFVQEVGRGQYNIIDCLISSGQGLPWYAQQCKGADLLSDCGHRKKYVYRDFVMPHDAKVRDYATGITRQDTWRELMGQSPLVMEKGNPADGIHAVRMLLGSCWFDETRCRMGIRALKEYERKWDEKNKIYQDIPKHNWASHPADAFRTFADGVRPSAKRGSWKSLQTQAESDYNEFGD